MNEKQLDRVYLVPQIMDVQQIELNHKFSRFFRVIWGKIFSKSCSLTRKSLQKSYFVFFPTSKLNFDHPLVNIMNFISVWKISHSFINPIYIYWAASICPTLYYIGYILVNKKDTISAFMGLTVWWGWKAISKHTKQEKNFY